MSKNDDLRARIDSLESEVALMRDLLSKVAGIVARRVEPLEPEADERFYWLRNAAFAHDWDAAQRMIEEDPAIVEATNSLGETALHFLAVENQVDAVEFLARHGSSINGGAGAGISPIVEAAQLGHAEMVDLLLSLGARADPHELMAEARDRNKKRVWKRVRSVLRSHGLLL